MPRTSSASRARRIRRIGLLGLLLTTLLTPAGIIISTVTAAALIGGAFHLSRAEPETTVTPVYPVTVKTGNPQHLNIGRDGKTVALVIAEETPGQGSGAGSFDPANPLFAGLAGNGPTQPGTPAGMPSGRSPGKSMPAGGFGPGSGSPANPPSLGGPPGDGAPSGLPPGAKPPATPSVPPVAGGPHPPTGKDDPDETSNEEGAPDKPDETHFLPPPEINSQPNPGNQPPGNGPTQDTLPGPDTLPGLPIPPLADTQTQPPGKELATQPNAVPEPSMLGLMLLGVAALVWSGRRRPDLLSPA
ncbi:MAG: PEP-CTERM sorting domain-containing protein [Thiobacillus sp.]|uniref:PEP-CTERM sorting domain-containing protein n=1 Tax=Thiobacillus sp. TaxID=924 RepID=UPI0027363C72|nr:PEP-CTERM sorting domain-containing protein [Thiobacillus sp.]MDP3585328.1 PEP-CTERM sorting domain-containing protein [Thiobacillus sp.]